MNLVDWIIVGIIGVSVLFGFYRGFVASVLNVGGGLIAFLLSFLTYPHLAGFVRGNDELIRTLENWLDASKLTSGIQNVQETVGEWLAQGETAITDMISQISLPGPLNALLEANINSGVNGEMAVNELVAQTVLNASINVLCFIVSFIVLYIVLSIVFAVIKAVFHLPVLKQLDWVAGGVFGLLRGALLCFVCLTVVPLLETVLPMDVVNEQIGASSLAAFFSNGNLFLSIMNKGL